MKRITGRVNRLLMMRKKGLNSPFMQNIGNGFSAKSMGNAVEHGGANGYGVTFLVDEDGNRLTDGDGNLLTA